MKPNFKSEKGITMLALMVTIITLIILAGVTLYSVINFNIVDNATEAKVKSDLKTVYEQLSEVINAKKLDGEDVTVLELRLDALDQLEASDPDIYEKIQNMDPEILSMLIISQGDIKYIEDEIKEYCKTTDELDENGNIIYDQERFEEILNYLKEIGIEEFVAKDSKTTQQVSKVIISPGGESVAGTKTKITKNITTYEYHVSIVLDLSASMDFGIEDDPDTWRYDETEEALDDDDPNQRLYVAKNAINTFIDSFYETQEKGQLQVITFNFNNQEAKRWTHTFYSGTMLLKGKDKVTVLAAQDGVARNKTEAQQIKTAISDIALPDSLGTYYYDAMDLSRSYLKSNSFTSTARTETETEETSDTITITNKTIENKKIMIFLSDGEPNDSTNNIISLANTIKNTDGIDLYTIGFSSGVTSNILSQMASTKDGTTLYYVANNAAALTESFNSILESATTEQGQEAVFEETIITEPEVSDVGSVNTSKNNNLLTYEIVGGTFDKTSPVEICRKEGDSYTVLRSYYVNNLPESISYDGTAVYWDLSKEDDELIGDNIVLRFSVIEITSD